jgi:DNA replication ATP-dependent helicase Dna2
VVRNEELGTSLFERLHDAHPESAVMLDTQYRMAQRIQAFSSREFYDGALRPASADVATQTLADLGVDVDRLPGELRDPVAFVDTPGDDGRHTDATEADRVASAVNVYLDAGVDAADIGVIAPFRAQVTELARRLPEGVVADTVDRFQGSAKEVILVSFVATGSLDGPIFEDHRRLNVALTRAKKALVLVGDERALRSDPLYERMVDWAKA